MCQSSFKNCLFKVLKYIDRREVNVEKLSESGVKEQRPEKGQPEESLSQPEIEERDVIEPEMHSPAKEQHEVDESEIDSAQIDEQEMNHSEQMNEPDLSQSDMIEPETSRSEPETDAATVRESELLKTLTEMMPKLHFEDCENDYSFKKVKIVRELIKLNLFLWLVDGYALFM